METTTQVHIPIGQQLLKAGFPEITYEEIRERLKCDEISEMENDLIRQRAQERCDQLNKKRRVFKYKVTQRDDTYYIEYPLKTLLMKLTDGFIGVFLHNKYEFDMVECKPKYIALESYAKQEIPQRALLSLQHASQLGLKHFWVAYPQLRPKGDPIIIGEITNWAGYTTNFFVCQW